MNDASLRVSWLSAYGSAPNLGRVDDADRILVCVGRGVAGHREAQGMSQEHMGFQDGLHRDYIAGTKRGERNISSVALSYWLPALRVSWDDFGRNVDKALRE